MSTTGHDFVDWREQFVSQERGSRVVHYYLEDSSGESFLAAVGTERSLRHMLYVVAEEFLQVIGADKSGALCLKWRSRREVVDWLTSFLPKRICHQGSPTNDAVDGVSDPGSYPHKHKDHFARSLKGYYSDIVWSGVSSTCSKQLRHYHAFCRNGTTIAINSFVLVMSVEEENRYLAYLEDMYEDKKGQKKVKVRWFHQNREVIGTIPPPAPHPREVFITPYSQVISAECVDDLATVLTPEHYDKCLAFPHALLAAIHLCYRQFSKSKFKPFDLSTLRGYFNQLIFSSLEICCVSGEEEEEFIQGNDVKRGPKRIRGVGVCQSFLTERFSIKMTAHARKITTSGPAYQNLRFGLPGRRPLAVKFIGPRPWLTLPFKVDEKMELLCQDSGIRGCWFRCTVFQSSHKRLKIRYDDVQNEDGCGNLEEWIPAFRYAAPDKLGTRYPGRLMIRPCRPSDDSGDNSAFEIGSPVDAWWSDGWWEGVIIRVGSCADDDRLQVYFPGEDVILNCEKTIVRISKDWIGNRWVNIEAKRDILSVLSAVCFDAKISAGSTFAKASELCSSAMSDHDATTAPKLNSIEENERAPTSLSSENNGLVENFEVGDFKEAALG